MRFATFFTFATATLLGSLAACTGGSGGNDAGPDGGTFAALPSPALDPVDACHQLAAALASLEVRCNRLASVDQASWAAANCAGWIDTQQAEFDAGLLAYDPVAVACEANLRTRPAFNRLERSVPRQPVRRLQLSERLTAFRSLRNPVVGLRAGAHLPERHLPDALRRRGQLRPGRRLSRHPLL